MHNMHALLKEMFRDYARQLRDRYNDRKIRTTMVFESAIKEYARLGYIVLVDKMRGIPPELSEHYIQRVKRIRHQPVWMPSRKFPNMPLDLLDEVRPSIRDGEITWRLVRTGKCSPLH
jgi:hypothetical protein